jgi:CheY-like chemotaxis protein
MYDPTTILLAEDNPQDVRLLQYALSQLDTSVNLLHYLNGQVLLDAIPELYAASVACVLVDLNMPLVDGFELISRLRAHEDFRFVPIVVFTNTNSNEERLRCYKLGANAYVPKPLEIEELVEAVKHIFDFWVKTNTRVL